MSGIFSTSTCFSYEMVTSNGVWDSSALSDFALPVFLIYAVAALCTSQALSVILRRFRQPRVVAELITGIIWGPTLAGHFLRIKQENSDLYTLYTENLWVWNIYETAAHLGLFFFIFIVGVNMDVSLLMRTAKKSLVVAVAGMAFPFSFVVLVAFICRHSFYKDGLVGENSNYLLLVSTLLSATSLPVMSRILAELKLLSTDMGRIALCAAMINDMVAWGVLPVFISGMGLSPNINRNPTIVNIWNYLATICALLTASTFAVRPVVWWIQRQTPEGEKISNNNMGIMLGGALLAGFVSDGLGVHYLFGGFLYGLAIPSGPVATAIVEMLEDLVVSMLLPLYFTMVGVSTDFTALFNRAVQAPSAHPGAGPTAAIVIAPLIGGAAKIGGTVLASLALSMPMNEALSLGFLMNCKSMLELMILDIGDFQQVLKPASFAILVIDFFLMTLLVTPAVSVLYKPLKLRPHLGYKRRNLQLSKPDSEIRMLTCVHHARNVPAVISLLEVSNPTKRSPIFVYALHLVELSGHASAMLIHHANTIDRVGASGRNNRFGQSEHIISAFEAYEQHSGGISVQPLTAIAPYPTMDEDVCAVAGDRRTAIIILPFHKELAVDGTMEEIHPAIRGLNQRILQHAPCSVGILIDRGMSGTARYAGGHHHHVAILFIGGPDDREALAFGWRMAEHPGVTVTVVRFLPGEVAAMRQFNSPAAFEEGSRVIAIGTPEADREQDMDEEYVNEFRLRYVSDKSVIYTEMVVNNSEETVEAIRTLHGNHELYVVGAGRRIESPLTAGLKEWSEFPELGPIGDLLASTDFGMMVSVLVVQQYVGSGGEATLVGVMPDSPVRQVGQYLNAGHHKTRGGKRPAGGFKWLGGS